MGSPGKIQLYPPINSSLPDFLHWLILKNISWYLGGPKKGAPPVLIRLIFGCSIVNHPAIGVPAWNENIHTTRSWWISCEYPMNILDGDGPFYLSVWCILVHHHPAQLWLRHLGPRSQLDPGQSHVGSSLPPPWCGGRQERSTLVAGATVEFTKTGEFVGGTCGAFLRAFHPSHHPCLSDFPRKKPSSYWWYPNDKTTNWDSKGICLGYQDQRVLNFSRESPNLFGPPAQDSQEMFFCWISSCMGITMRECTNKMMIWLEKEKYSRIYNRMHPVQRHDSTKAWPNIAKTSGSRKGHRAAMVNDAMNLRINRSFHLGLSGVP